MRFVAALSLLSALALGFVGCAKSKEPASPAAEPAPPPQTPSGGESAAPTTLAQPEAQAEAPADEDADLHADLTTLDKAEAALARAQGILDGLYVADGTTVTRQDARKEGRPRAAAPSRAPAEDAEEKTKDDRSRCDVACRAFASLGRAAGAVCRLTGDTAERCTRARRLVDDNAARVAGCGCRG